MPERIQRQRTKGWRMPDGAVYVGRPSRWGNLHVVGQQYMWLSATNLTFPIPTARPAGEYEHGIRVETCPDAATAVAWYRARWTSTPGYDLMAKRVLAGRDLCCWCPLDQPCHADVLIELANGP